MKRKRKIIETNYKPNKKRKIIKNNSKLIHSINDLLPLEIINYILNFCSTQLNDAYICFLTCTLWNDIMKNLLKKNDKVQILQLKNVPHPYKVHTNQFINRSTIVPTISASNAYILKYHRNVTSVIIKNIYFEMMMNPCLCSRCEMCTRPLYFSKYSPYENIVRVFLFDYTYTYWSHDIIKFIKKKFPKIKTLVICKNTSNAKGIQQFTLSFQLAISSFEGKGDIYYKRIPKNITIYSIDCPSNNKLYWTALTNHKKIIELFVEKDYKINCIS